MFHHAIQNPADTERGFYHVRRVFPHVVDPCPLLDRDEVFVNLYRTTTNLRHFNTDLACLFEVNE